MKKAAANTAPTLSGNSVEELKRSLDSALRLMWNKINNLSDKVNNMSSGSQSLESKREGIRLVQDKDNYYLEARFDNGWARMNSNFELINKKE